MKFNEMMAGYEKSTINSSQPNAINDKKTIKLQYHTVDVNADKDVINGKDTFMLSIKSQKDPNIKGYVSYESAEDLRLAYNNINSMGDLIDFMDRNSKEFSTAFKWDDIVVDEINANNLIASGKKIDDVVMSFVKAKSKNSGFGREEGMEPSESFGNDNEEMPRMGMGGGGNEPEEIPSEPEPYEMPNEESEEIPSMEPPKEKTPNLPTNL